MIEQQYYTRGRGGLFSQTEGYDTVAKSPVLKLDFIKKNLHPLCSYDIPSELQKAGEEDERKYPPNFIIMPLESGEMVIGQAVYKSRDFTGLRSAFFMHNYVLSEKERRRYIKDPEKIFGINSFASEYNKDTDGQLPTLAAIPYEISPLFENREQLFRELGMDEKLFMQLIYAVFISVYSRKKIFIVLDVPLEKLGIYAKALLYHLYASLPWSIAEKLGVSTYSGKAEARKNVQITFLDKTSLHYDSRINREFVFDFVNHKFLNCDEQVEKLPYFTTALKYAASRMAWEKYNELAEQLGNAVKSRSDKDIYFFGQAAVIFEMYMHLKGNKHYEPDPDARKGLMAALFNYCNAEISEDTLKEMQALMEYTIGIFHEAAIYGRLWDEDEIDVLLKYKLSCTRGTDEKIYCQQIILRTINEAVKERKPAYVDEVMRKTRRYPAFYQQLLRAVYQDETLRKNIIYRQLEQSISQSQNIQELKAGMENWKAIEEILTADLYYKEAVLNKFQQLIEKSRDKVRQLIYVQEWCKGHDEPLYQDMVEMCESWFLSTVNIENEIQDERTLCSLHFSNIYKEETYDIITAYQKLKNDISSMSPGRIKIDIRVQELIKRYYRQTPKKENFYMLVYAFLRPGEPEKMAVLQLKKVLGYLYEINTDLMFAFIIWSKGQKMYIDKKKFDSQVVSFFLIIKEKKQKMPKARIREKLAGHAKTRQLADKIIKAQRPLIVRVISKHAVAFSILLAVIVAAGGAGGYFYHEKNKEILEQSFKKQVTGDENVQILIKHFAVPGQDVEAYIKEHAPELLKEKEKGSSEAKDEKNKTEVSKQDEA